MADDSGGVWARRPLTSSGTATNAVKGKRCVGVGGWGGARDGGEGTDASTIGLERSRQRRGRHEHDEGEGA
jgi:hypothetical protein